MSEHEQARRLFFQPFNPKKKKKDDERVVTDYYFTISPRGAFFPIPNRRGREEEEVDRSPIRVHPNARNTELNKRRLIIN